MISLINQIRIVGNEKMSLFLVESASLEQLVQSKEQLEEKVAVIQKNLQEKGAELLELQVSTNFDRSFFIVEAKDESEAVTVLEAEDIVADLVKEVRLVGDDLERVKGNKDVLNYLVEWNLPEDLTMDQYLDRKNTNSVHYEEVPEVEFARTYVCEDMTKCLCFYDAPDLDAVERARKAVKAPIDTVTEILPKE